MRIEERGYSMITDKQGREWLLQKLYDEGYRYYVMDSYGNVYLTNEKPHKEPITGELKVSRCRCAISVSRFKNILPELKCNECISIAEELGIVDWSKVKVDTPILVKDFEAQTWKNRYFAKVQNGTIYAWDSGATSWSTNNRESCIVSWAYAKLAEV
mgnify:CR=1 FL=1